MCYEVEICARCGKNPVSKGEWPTGAELDYTICSDCIFDVSWEELDYWEGEATASPNRDTQVARPVT